MVSPNDHVVMNHQNQTRTNGIWGHVRYRSPAIELYQRYIDYLDDVVIWNLKLSEALTSRDPPSSAGDDQWCTCSTMIGIATTRDRLVVTSYVPLQICVSYFQVPHVANHCLWTNKIKCGFKWWVQGSNRVSNGDYVFPSTAVGWASSRRFK
jgi:hypothetical protein